MLYPLSYEGKLLGNPWYVYLSGLLGEVCNTLQSALGPHLGRTVTSVHRFCEAIKVIFEKMCVPVKGNLCRRMTEHSLYCFHARPS